MGTFDSPAPAPAPGVAPAAAPGAFDRTAFRDAWQSQGGGQTGESLSRFIASHPEFSTGVQQAGAHGDTVTLPTGEQLDLIGDVGGTGQSNWTGVGPGSARSGGPGVGPGGGSTGTAWGPSGSSFAGGGFSYKPWDQKFVAPTNVTEANDPGFQFRLDQGQRALQRSAAASGTLLTGGTAQDLQNLGQQQASAEYGNVYNRAMQQYQQGYGDYLGNYNRAFQDYQANFANDLSNRELGLRAQGQYFGQDLATNQNQSELNQFLWRILQAEKDAEKQAAIRNYLAQAESAAAAGRWEEALAILDGALEKMRGEPQLQALRCDLNDRWQAELRRRRIEALLTEVRDLELSTSVHAARERLAEEMSILGEDPSLAAELERFDSAIEAARRDASIASAVTEAAKLLTGRQWKNGLGPEGSNW